MRGIVARLVYRSRLITSSSRGISRPRLAAQYSAIACSLASELRRMLKAFQNPMSHSDRNDFVRIAVKTILLKISLRVFGVRFNHRQYCWVSHEFVQRFTVNEALGCQPRRANSDQDIGLTARQIRG
jgi:hypothetical protein